ncbi:hypothetical protein [Methylomicrobium agile]|uniref:hypothetical protein n=1 Tax=Methylomicrobium agile TaxID=39774 RepID=UPI0004DF5BE6|nr:hypothetical protein [Methylomicrobium agile]
MNVGLAIESNETVERFLPIMEKLYTELKIYFYKRDYGKDLQDLAIGLILTGPGTEKFHPIRSFKYEKESSYKDIFTNKRVNIKNAASYDVKPDFERFSQMTLDDAQNYLAELLFESTEVLESNHEKFPNFDVKQFRKDFANCLRGCSSRRSE